MNALENDSKFKLSWSSPLLLTSAKRKTPIIEYKYSNRSSNPPTFANAGKVKIKVLNTNLRSFALFTNLKILVILKALIIVVAPPNEKLAFIDKNTLTVEPITIIKSKIFQLF